MLTGGPRRPCPRRAGGGRGRGIPGKSRIPAFLVAAGPAQRGAVHGHPGRHRGERRAAVDRPVAALLPRRAAVGRDRLRPGQRRAGAGRGASRRPGRAAPDVPGRADRVHRGLAGQRPGAEPGRPDRGTGRPGPGRGPAHPGRPVDHHHDLRGRPARDRAGHLGRARRGRRGRRGAGGRRADHLARLALGVPGQRPHRGRGRAAEPAHGAPAQRAGPGLAAVRPGRRGAGHRRSGVGRVRDRRRAVPRLGIRPDPAGPRARVPPCWRPSRPPSGGPRARCCRRSSGAPGRWSPGCW